VVFIRKRGEEKGEKVRLRDQKDGEWVGRSGGSRRGGGGGA